MKLNFRKYLNIYLISALISLVIGAVIFVIYFFSNDRTMYAAINGSSLAAVILLSLGGLMFVAGEGFFDIFSYGFKQVGSSLFSKKPNENNDFASYKEASRTKREDKPKIFLGIIISGLICLIAMIVLRIIGI